MSRTEAALLLAEALERQAGVVVAPTGKGNAVVTFDPRLPLESGANVIRQTIGDLGLSRALQVRRAEDESAPRIFGKLDQATLELLQVYLASALKGLEVTPSFAGISIVEPQDLQAILHAPARNPGKEESLRQEQLAEEIRRRALERRQAGPAEAAGRSP
jgi:hypothetical protein